jgi:hypothetical protein
MADLLIFLEEWEWAHQGFLTFSGENGPMVLAPIVELEPIAVHVPATWTRDGLPGLGRGSDTSGPLPRHVVRIAA